MAVQVQKGFNSVQVPKVSSSERVPAISQHSAQLQRGSSKSLACDGSRNQVDRVSPK